MSRKIFTDFQFNDNCYVIDAYSNLFDTFKRTRNICTKNHVNQSNLQFKIVIF